MLTESLKNKIDSYISKGIILLYHRVDTDPSDNNQLCVSKENFSDHINFLIKKYKIGLLKERNFKEKQIYITFDDGYQDNYINALPILEKYKCPATFYVTANKIGDSDPFYWDNKMTKARALTHKELVALSQSPLIEIGAHTLSHERLSTLQIDEQKREIIYSKKKIEKIINQEVVGFSYPFGSRTDFNNDTLKIVREAKYGYACANWPGFITGRTDKFMLPRIIVRDWNINEFQKKLERWL